jgi:hypothetical protein
VKTARIAASVVIAGAVALGASACNLVTYQATTEQYDASDGVSGTIGALDIRNALLVTGDGETASFVGTVVNSGDDDVRLGLQYENASGEKVTEQFWVPAGGSVTPGFGEEAQLLFTDLDGAIGGYLDVFAQFGTEQGKLLTVPVLDGSLPEYEALLPADFDGDVLSVTDPDYDPRHESEGEEEGGH